MPFQRRRLLNHRQRVLSPSDPDEFYDKLKFYKNNPPARMKIAAAGHEKIHREYSNVAVTKYMAELLFGEKTSALRPWQILLKD